MRGKFLQKGSKEYWASLYKSYTSQRETAQIKHYMLRKQLSFSAFKETYALLQEKGVRSNVVRTLVNEETLISYAEAKEMVKWKNPEAKLTRENIVAELHPARITELMGEPFVEFGQRVSQKGMTMTQAYFAYMAELGLRDEAEADYGY